MERMVGIDWSNHSHQVEVQTETGEVILTESYSADCGGLYELRDELLEWVEQPEHLKIGLEDPSRPVVRVLLEAGMEVFILTPPKVDAVRSVYSEAQVKDDRLDAHIICEELRVHRNVFYKLVPRRPVIAALSQYHRALEDTKSDVNRLANRLREKLRDYFPQFLELDWELTSRVMLDLLELIPEPAAVEEVTVEEVDEVLGRCRKHSAREVLEILGGKSPRLANRLAGSIAEIAREDAKQLRTAVQAEETWEERLVGLLEEISEKQKSGELPTAGSLEEDDSSTQKPARGGRASNSGDAETEDDEPLSDIEIALSTKGVGVRTVAGMFAEGFQSLVTLDRELLRRQSIAPVTEQTGKQSSSEGGPDPWVHRRHARNRYLNDVMHQMGDSLQRQNGHYRSKYVKMRDKNHTHGRSCRQLTDQYLRVLFAMLRDRTTYDPALHGATRR